ncbi:MAP3K12-binding inhibitory protein 1 [Bienertia sinuspersici]
MVSSTLQFPSQFTTLQLNLFHPNQTSHTLLFSPLKPSSPQKLHLKCTQNSSLPVSVSPSEPLDNFPTPENTATTPAEQFPIEKRRKSEIIRDRKARRQLEKPEPPNFEIGWKRTKPIDLEKPTGYVIMDFLDKFEGLMNREFGSTELLAKAGEIVAERAREEAEDLRDEGKVDDRMVTELSRVLKLMEMDLAMVKAAFKEETLEQRLEHAKARCRQAILVAKSF